MNNGAPPQGYTAPVNTGIRAAHSPYVVVLNDDVECLDGWWPPLRRSLDEGAQVAFPMTVDGWMRRDFAAWCFALSRSSIERFGYSASNFFDPRFKVWFQDSDLLVRLRAAGVSPVLVEESRILHGLSATLRRTDDSALRTWIDDQIRQDHLAFQAKHPSEPIPLPAGSKPSPGSPPDRPRER